MTGSLAPREREKGNHPLQYHSFLFLLTQGAGAVILSERAERARAKDLLFSPPSPKVVLRTGGNADPSRCGAQDESVARVPKEKKDESGVDSGRLR